MKYQTKSTILLVGQPDRGRSFEYVEKHGILRLNRLEKVVLQHNGLLQQVIKQKVLVIIVRASAYVYWSLHPSEWTNINIIANDIASFLNWFRLQFQPFVGNKISSKKNSRKLFVV